MFGSILNDRQSAKCRIIIVGSYFRPTGVDLTTADTSQNDIQPRSSIRGRSQAESVPSSSSNGRRSNRRGTATPDLEASGNSAGGASVQRTSRKINADTNARPSFKNTRRGSSSKKLTTEATSVKDEIDESENYPPEFIHKIKSSVDTKDVKTTQSSFLTSSSEDTFITKSSDKVVSVFTPSLPEDGTNTDEEKDNQNNEVNLNKLETRRRPNKYTGRTRSYKTGSNETGKQRKVDLLLAPSPPPSEREVTKPTVRSSSQSQYKSSSGYSLRGSKKDTVTEDTSKVETPSPPTPDTLQLDSPITAPTQSTRAAFRPKSNLRTHQVSKPETENIVTAPGGTVTQNSQDPSVRPSFRRAFPTRSRSAAYKNHPSRNEQSSASTEDNIISSRSYTPRPTSGKTRTTSSFRRSIAATTDDIQNEIQTSAQPPSTPRSLVGTQRFSARFRSDLLLATGGLRSTTTTPAYIPTVPLIRAASTTTTETSAENPSEGLTLDESSLTMTRDDLLDDSFQDRVKVDNDVSFHLDNSTEMNHVDQETVKSHFTSSSSVPFTTVASLSPASDNNNINAQEMTTTEIIDSVLTTLNPGTTEPPQTTNNMISSLSQSYVNESTEAPVTTETVSEVPEIRSTTYVSRSTNIGLRSSTQKRRLPLRKDFAIALLKIVSRVNRPTVPLYVTTVTSSLNEESTVPYSPPVTTAAEMISELSQQDFTTFSPLVTLQAKKITTRAVTYSPKVVSSATVETTPQSSTENIKTTSVSSVTEKMPEVSTTSEIFRSSFTSSPLSASVKTTSVSSVTEKMPEISTTSEIFRSSSTSSPLSASVLSLSPGAVNSTTATPIFNVTVPLSETTISEIVTVASSTESPPSTISEIKPPTSTKAVNILAKNNSIANFVENITSEIKASPSSKVLHISNSSSPEVLKIRNSEIRFVSVDRPPLESDNLVTESPRDFTSSVRGPMLLDQSTTNYSSTEQVSTSSTVQIPTASSTMSSTSQFTSAEMLTVINTSTRAASVESEPPKNDTLASNQPINPTSSTSLNTSSSSFSVTEPPKLISDTVTQSILSSAETDSLASTRFPVRITIAPRGTASTTTISPFTSNGPVAQRRFVDVVSDETQYFATPPNYQTTTTTTTVRTPLPFVIFGIFPNNTVFRKYPHSGKTEQVSENEIARHQEYYPEEQTSQTSYTTSVTGDTIANEILYRNALRNSVQTSLPRATVNRRLPAGRNPSENEVAWALGTGTSIPILPAQSEIASGQQTEMINDTKNLIPGSETIVVSASERSVIPTVTQRIQSPVTFAFPSEVSNSVYNVQGSKYSNYWSSSTTEKPRFHYITSNSISAQNIVEKTTDNGISSTTTEKLNFVTKLPVSTNAQIVSSTTLSSTEATVPLSSSTTTVRQTTAKLMSGVPTLETVGSIPSGMNNPQEITTPVISLREPTEKLSTVERIGSTLSSSVPTMKEKVTATERVTTERVLKQSATSPSPPLSIRGLISRVLGNIGPGISTAATASPIMTVTAKRQLTTMTSLPAQNVGGRQQQRKANLADKVIEAALQRSSTTSLPLFNNNLPKTKVIQTLENGVESNRFSLDLLGQQSRKINADDVTDAPTVTSSTLELDTSKNTPLVSSKSPTVETVTSGKLSPQDEQILLALFGNQISAAVQQPKSQNTRSRSRLSPDEQLLAALLRQQATSEILKASSKGSQQQKESNSGGLSLSTPSTRAKSQGLPVSGKKSEEELLLSLLGGQPKTAQKTTEQGLPVSGKKSEEELLLSLLGGQPKTAQKTTEQVNSTRTKLSDEEFLAALLSGQSKGTTRIAATTQRASTKPRRLLTDEQIIAGLLAGSTPASPADQARLNELLNGGRHRTRVTTTTPAVPRGLGFLVPRPGSQGLFSSALQPDAESIDPDLGGGEDGIRGPREQGTLVKAAIDVTKAVSQFMSAVIQGATRSFQSFFRSGTNLLSQYFSLGSAQAGNFQLR